MVYDISCDTSCVSVLRICFELWGKYITGWYLSISGCLHNSDKKVTILFQNCKYSRSHLKSHCCHWLICHFSSRLLRSRVIPPNPSNPPLLQLLSSSFHFPTLSSICLKKVITTSLGWVQLLLFCATPVQTHSTVCENCCFGSQWHFNTTDCSLSFPHVKGLCGA